MPWGSIISGAGSLLGGLFGSDSAEDAAAAQQAAAKDALNEQKRQYDLNRADQAPFMRTGTLANQRLAQLLGLGGTPGGRGSESRDQLRSRLVGQFTRTTPGTSPVMIPTFGREGNSDSENVAEMLRAKYAGELNGTPGKTTIDEIGLQSAIDSEMARSGGIDSDAGDYGSLLRNFSAADLEADPVYQSGLKFGLDQGTGAINQRAIAGGGYDSGATLKALTRYANDYGSTKANESYNRFNTNQGNVYNRLAGISGTGQTAVNNVASSGTQISQNMANTMTDAGNARAAGIVGGANAWSDAIGGVGNAAQGYFSQKRLKGLLGTDTYQTPPYYDYGSGGPQ